MSAGEPVHHEPPWGDGRLAELAESALTATGLAELAETALRLAAEMTNADWAFLYVCDGRLPSPQFLPHGMSAQAAAGTARSCAEQLAGLSGQAAQCPRAIRGCGDARCGGGAAPCAVAVAYPLLRRGGILAWLGVAGTEPSGRAAQGLPDRWQALLASAVDRLVERAEAERRLWHLTTYQTVSSLLMKPLDLHELLSTALQCSMEAVSAEAASVLLLDEAKENFRFYQVEGPAKPALMTATFPADRGLAGAVLRSQQAEIVNDVHSDPRFYTKVDSESGFGTRNMIAVPLTAGQERVGVLEVLNKANGGDFTPDEQFLLASIAEEIAFAIRNAIVFEYVVNTYCRQRQGQPSCRGCRRPLGSWTPCARYRQSGI